MPVSLLYSPIWQITDSNGNPVPFARIYSYQAGTSIPLSLYSDAAGLVPLAHGVQSDGGGRLVAYLQLGLSYKINVLDAHYVQVVGYPVDQVTAFPPVSPTLLPGYSSTVFEQGLTMDPGEPGGEHLAATMADELKQLRFRLAEMTGEVWNQTHTTRFLPVQVSTDSPTFGIWPPTIVSNMDFWFPVPKGWQVGTPLALRWIAYPALAGGVAALSWRYQRNRHGAVGLTSPYTAYPIDYATLPFVEVLFPFDPGFFAVGDWGIIRITRTGPDGNAGDIVLQGAVLEYTGVGSR